MAASEARDLRQFGLTVGGLTIAVFGLIRPLLHHAMPLWPWLVGIGLILAALSAPKILRYPHQGWTMLGHALGWLNSRIILNLLFFVVFVPAALIARRLGWDPLERRFDQAAASYRRPSSPISAANLERPY